MKDSLKDSNLQVIPPKTGTAFRLDKGDLLKVVDLEGEQVSDFFCFAKDNFDEYLSSGRTFDYLEKIYIAKGDKLYSSKSRPLVKIAEDTVDRHDFLLTPCSRETFEIIYNDNNPHRGCEGNLLASFKDMGIELDSLPSTFNVFMNVRVREDGTFSVDAPTSRAGDFIVFEALEDLVVGLTACSAAQSNNGSFKPIGYLVMKADA